MEKEAGGIMTAHGASALPRGRQQVDDIRRGALSEVDTDFLYAMMVMCKESEGKKCTWSICLNGECSSLSNDGVSL